MFSTIYNTNLIEPPRDTSVPYAPLFGVSESDFRIGTDNRNFHLARPEDKVIVLPDFERGIIRYPTDPRVHYSGRVVTENLLNQESRTLLPIFFLDRKKPTTEWVPFWKLLVSHIRRDQVSELREVIFTDGWGALGSPDLPFSDEFLLRPLKQLTKGDPVFILPDFDKKYVLQTSQDPEFLWLTDISFCAKPVPGGTECYKVPYHSVRFLQTYQCEWKREGVETKVLLAPNFRGVVKRGETEPIRE